MSNTGLIDYVPVLKDTIWKYTSGPDWFCTKINMALASDSPKLEKYAKYIRELKYCIGKYGGGYSGTVLRGVNFTQKEIKAFRALGKQPFYLPSFTSGTLCTLIIYSRLQRSSTQLVMLIPQHLSALEANISALTLREAMCALENHCVLAILGSTSQMKKRQAYCFADLEKIALTDGQVNAKLRAFQLLTEDDKDCLAYFKIAGNNFAHVGCMTHVARPEQLHNPLEDDESTQNSKVKMLNLLAQFCTQSKVPFGASPLAKRGRGPHLLPCCLS